MRTYKRLGCTIEIQESAETVLSYLNISIDQFANHLYLFAMDQQVTGSDKLTVRCSKTYLGEASFSIGFEWFKLPEHLVPEAPSIYLKELKEKDPELYKQVVVQHFGEFASNGQKETKGEKE
jgi:hypothetical protein